MWEIFDSVFDQTQEINVCHEMAVKITGEEDIEIVFSMSSEPSSEVCSVDSLSEDPPSYYDFSEPSNSLLLEEEIDEKRARKHGKTKFANSISRISTTMTTETETTSTRTISNNTSGKTASANTVFVNIDDFQEEQDRRDKDRRQRRQRRERMERDNDDEIDDQDDGPRTNGRISGPLQRKGSEETEDSDIDDSLVFDDDFVASFGDEDEQEEGSIRVYDDVGEEDLAMELVDDDDIDDDVALTRLIDIHIGDMMDGSSHMDKISMRLRPTFDLPTISAPNTGVEATNKSVTPIFPNHSKSNSKRRQQLSLPQIIEQEVEEDQEGSERQACIEEIEDPHLRTLLKTISRTSKCSERFDMNVLLQHFQKEHVQDPKIQMAIQKLSFRIDSSNSRSKSSRGEQIEEIDLDLFFDDIRKGVEQESRHDARTKREKSASTEERDSATELLFQISDDIVLERGMSSLTMGHKTCISASSIEDSLIRALNTPLARDGNNENKVHSANIFGQNKSKKKIMAEKIDSKQESNQPFSTLNNKGNLSSRFKIKQKLTRNSTKMGKTVGKFLSIAPSSSNNIMDHSPTFTAVTLGSSISGRSNGIIDPPFGSNDKTNPSRKNRIAQLWRKAKPGAIGRRGDSYQTLNTIGERASA
ncbi:MAG: hypothetical protein SGBAC_004698 [Bacillariaceae sp.]